MPLSLRIALASLATHRLRTALAVLGVLFGAFVLTGVLHVTRAMVVKAEQETEKLGPNLIMAAAGQARFRRSGGARIRDAATTFTRADAKALAGSLPSLQGAAPFISETMALRAGARKVPAQMVATTPSYTRVRNFQPDLGRFFTREELDQRAKVCVLGRTVAERLFGKPENAVGRTVFLFRAQIRVLGVMEAKGKDLSGTDQDEQVFVPLTTFMRRFSNRDFITGVYLNAAEAASMDQLVRSAETLLRRRHRIGPGEEDDFSVFTARQAMQVQRQALDLVWTLGVISSTISFAIGALGIGSIMILLVRARRLEIGVRRAVGAKRRDIMRQFWLESAVMSGAGGGLGVALALGLVSVVYGFGAFPPVYDAAIIASALAGSVALGLAAGSWPAWRASRIEVLDALQGE
jgi:putative ABC transport system permease protein